VSPIVAHQLFKVSTIVAQQLLNVSSIVALNVHELLKAAEIAFRACWVFATFV
jgi:hypothetical protein